MSADPRRQPDPRDEIVAIVDADNRVVGSAPRATMRADNLPHRATYVVVYDSAGRVFVHKRTATKDVFPSHYDVAAGGVVLEGEDYETAARRELAEELGIQDVVLERRFDFFYRDERSRVWGRAFTCMWDGPMVLQAEEIESGAFHPVADVLAGACRPMTPDGLHVLERLAARDERLPGAATGPDEREDG